MLAAEQAKALVEKLDRECEIYAGLRSLSLRQVHIIETEADVKDLLDVLGRKQILINELGDVEREVNSFRKEWETNREALAEGARAGVGERLRKVKATLMELLRLEARALSSLERRHQDLSTGVRNIMRSPGPHETGRGGTHHSPGAGDFGPAGAR
jgi:flagellar biosynthesis/type III secretory pathway chaperone